MWGKKERSDPDHLIRRRPKVTVDMVHVADSLHTRSGVVHVAESFNVSEIGIFGLQRSREWPECSESNTGECRDVAEMMREMRNSIYSDD